MDNAAFDDKLFAIAKTIADDSIKRGAKWLVGQDDDWYHVPSQRECQKRWLGLESSSHYGRSINLAAQIVSFEKKRLHDILEASHLVPFLH
jgi:hypothetical protein